MILQDQKQALADSVCDAVDRLNAAILKARECGLEIVLKGERMGFVWTPLVVKVYDPLRDTEEQPGEKSS